MDNTSITSTLSSMDGLSSLILSKYLKGEWDFDLQKEAAHYMGEGETLSSLSRFFAGLKAYHTHPYRRVESNVPILWEEGSTRLLNYSVGEEKTALPPVLFVPSLINRSYILDLSEERSLVRYLAGQGFSPYLIDWGEPLLEELGFDCSHYVGRIQRVIEVLYARYKRPVTLIGYCMGGLMALAAAHHAGEKVKALGFLATPWDFYHTQLVYPGLGIEAVECTDIILQKMEKVPKSLLQAFFYSLNPQLIQDKFSAFSLLDPTSREAQEFVAVEHWVSDGISITSPVARECFIDWGYHNHPMQKQWCVSGITVDPSCLRIPAFIAIAEHDRIVPAAAALPLVEAIPQAMHKVIPSGHVGMIIGRTARQYLWKYLTEWLRCTIE